MSSQLLLQIALLLPLFAVPLIGCCGRFPNIRESVTLITATLLLIVVVTLYVRFQSGENIGFEWLEILPGLVIAFELEPLGVLFALIASFLWLVTSVYGMGYMRGNSELHQTRFFMLFPIAIAAALGIAFADNLITLFIFYEVMTISTYPLVTHKGNDNAIKSGRVYLGVLLSSSVGLLLPVIVWVWTSTGTTEFRPGGVLSDHVDGVALTAMAFMFVLGIGKAAVMPIHRWLPAAMVAPTPVSALLHAVAVVKAGVFSVVKVVVYTFGLDHLQTAPGIELLLYMALFTVAMASIIALKQDNLKRRLAYSTISQLSYVVMGALLLAPLSVLGAALHIAAHAFGKITLFFAAGSIYTASKKTEVSQLNGIGYRMPWTMIAFAIGSLSMIGIPPAVGFISKWYLVKGAFEAERVSALVVILLSTLLNTAYFVPIVYRAFFLPEAADNKKHGEAPLAMVLALTITAACTVLLFFFPQIPFYLGKAMHVI